MYSEITVVLRSGTQAIKAEKLLTASGIQARVVRPESDRNGKGCGFGVKVRADMLEKAMKTLKSAGIVPGKSRP